MGPLKLVVDANILFTGLIGKGVTKALLFSDNLELFAPEFLFDELKEHKYRIESISSLSTENIEQLVNNLEDTIKTIEKSEFEEFLDEANKLISDPDDTEYLALSLALNKCPIWSNDPHFKEQSAVQVFTTDELVKFLKTKNLF